MPKQVEIDRAMFFADALLFGGEAEEDVYRTLVNSDFAPDVSFHATRAAVLLHRYRYGS